MRLAVNLEFLDHIPMHATKKRPVLNLDIRKEGMAAHRVGRGDGEPDQRCAKRADLAKIVAHRKARSPPQAGLGLVNTNRADHLICGDAEHGQCNDGSCMVVDPVPVIAFEYLLLATENIPAKRMRFFALPVGCRELHLEFAGAERWEGFDHHRVNILS